jgi:hypothetical protein
MSSSPARAVGDQAPVVLPADLPVHPSASLAGGLAADDGAASSSLAAALAAVPHTRRRRGRRHELTGVLTIAACARLTGARSYVAINEALAQGAAVLERLGQFSEDAVFVGEPAECSLSTYQRDHPGPPSDGRLAR